jgi:hypothetical protein
MPGTPKKRGRKPKPKIEGEEKKVPKKRGRKPKEKYTAKNNVPINHKENYILHIPVESENNIILDETNPQPFDSTDNDELLITDDIHTPEVNNVVCMWCCNSFMTHRWGLPFLQSKHIYKTYGQFCSPECVSAYIFDDISSTDDSKWHCYSMVNNLARELYNDPEFMCKLAPPRNSLKMFGGKYSIDEFRSISTDRDRIVKVYLPPTISILHNVEEIPEDISSCNLKNNVMILQDERYKTIQDNLRLKRDKPLLNKKNTLEHCMQIQIS